MTESGRLDRLELKVDRLQEQAHQYHVELLSAVQKGNDLLEERVNDLESVTERHSSYFGMVLKELGLSGIITSWLSLKDYLGK